MFNDVSMLFKRIFAIFSTIFLMIAGISGIGSNTENPKVKNVILFIGDGMGENHLEWTKHELGVDLELDNFPIQGYSETNDYYGGVTDSAAGGTALACGIRTVSGSLGVYASDKYGVFSHPMNLCELAKSRGMKAGILTTDNTSGATPASFSSHVESRGKEKKITLQQLASDIDLIWGAPTASATAENIANSNNYNLVTSIDDIDALTEGEKSFGQFAGKTWARENDGGHTLSELTAKAISLLDNDEGFFLMIENDHIDSWSHRNVKEDMMEAVLEFDKAIQVGLDFADSNGETMIVVTADHETGAIKLNDGVYNFTSGSHSGVNVPLRVYGVDDFIENGKSMKNRMVPVYIADKLGFAKDDFPKQVYSDIYF